MRKLILSGAMAAVPDDMLQEALAVRKRNTAGKWILRTAACLAVVVGLLVAMLFWPESQDGHISVSGGIKVYAYDIMSATNIEDMDRYDLVDEIDAPPCFWNQSINCVHGLPLTLEMDNAEFADAKISFDVTARYGAFRKRTEDWQLEQGGGLPNSLLWENLGNSFSIGNGETIYWIASAEGETREEVLERDGGLFTDILIKADDHIVGYAVVEIKYTLSQGIPWYHAEVREAICFPMVDGTFQDISEEDVDEMFLAYRK